MAARMTRIALFQMNSGIDPEKNAEAISAAAREAASEGAAILFTPEMAGLLDQQRQRAAQNIVPESESPLVRDVGIAAAERGVWIALGLPVENEAGNWANRSLLFDNRGAVVARYDKIHMFDIELDDGEKWHESKAYEAGDQVISKGDTPVGRLGLTICYDLRFPGLFDALGRDGCDVIATPAAFTVPTGKDHWHLLQRARAVESSAFVVAAAQVGHHEDGRATYGHSLVVDPWGRVLLDMGGEGPGIGYCEIDLSRIEEVRRQLPSLANRRDIPRKSAQ